MSSVEKNFSVPGVGRVSVRVTDGPHTGLTIGGGDIDVAKAARFAEFVATTAVNRWAEIEAHG